VAINDRLQRLENKYPEPACEKQPCRRATAFTEWERREDDTLALVKGTPPPPLCAACPYREGGGPIRHVRVVRNAYGGEQDDE
jgi:hypothetical protein